jgi:hypothetical protein
VTNRPRRRATRRRHRAACGTSVAVLWHGRAPGEAIEAGALRVDGGRRAFARFARLFPAP